MVTYDNIPEVIPLSIYPLYAGGSRAAQTLLHWRILVLAHLMHITCIFLGFMKVQAIKKAIWIKSLRRVENDAHFISTWIPKPSAPQQCA